ncbi:MAG: NAD(P)/FAD-dependent oxidoreductase [Leptospiraceae bacterium]|nr:NAD(P)/FAD-dependent oxidoreductase [Leptospiraceae bacterium]
MPHLLVMDEISCDALIVGNGPAGIKAALTLREKDPKIRICIISRESLYFYSRPALMYVYMGSLRLEDTYPYEKNFWRKKNIWLLQDSVKLIDPQAKKAFTERNQVISFQVCLLATGARPKILPALGEIPREVCYFTNLADLKKLEELTHKPEQIKRAVVIGGGLIGVELAEMLSYRKIAVSFLVRENYFYPKALSEKEGRLVEKEICQHGVDLRLNCEVHAWHQEQGKLKGVVLANHSFLEAELACVAIGVESETELARNSHISCGEGILVNPALQTEYPHIFAAGDAAEIVKGDTREQYFLWYTAEKMGRLAGENMYAYLKGLPLQDFELGFWYNSAKFFRLDWQHFALFPHLRQTEREIFFSFEQGNKLLRLIVEKETISGMSALGLRLRERFCHQVLAEKRDVEYFLKNAQHAFFDPEFFPNYGKDLEKYALQEH